MSKVMVTGAGGYIGTQLVRDLVKAGHEVTAVDRFFFGKEPLSEFVGNKKVTIKQKDIRDLDQNDLKGRLGAEIGSHPKHQCKEDKRNRRHDGSLTGRPRRDDLSQRALAARVEVGWRT
jgi:nucleoside-diphosphate-sugar epimerase